MKREGEKEKKKEYGVRKPISVKKEKCVEWIQL
jgi:hypothetical protein